MTLSQKLLAPFIALALLAVALVVVVVLAVGEIVRRVWKKTH